MGRDYVHFTVTATVSRHNSAQDADDDDAWDELQRRVRELCDEAEFEGISPWV